MSDFALKMQRFGEALAGRGSEWDYAQEVKAKNELEREQYEAEERLKANLGDTRKMILTAQRGNPDGVRQLLGERIASLQASGGDPSHSIASFELLNADPQAWYADVVQGERLMSANAGQESMFGGATEKYLGMENGVAMYDVGGRVEARPIEGYQAPQPTERETLELDKLRAEINKIKAEASAPWKDPDVAEIEKEQKKEQLKINVDRLGVLSEGAKERNASIEKATYFRDSLANKKKSSGTSTVVYDWVVPGVWTDQGQFNEEFDAFAEVAARQLLKASGETKPTDSDVAGMKRSIFGVGRDEGTNVQLLGEFISAQRGLQNELQALRDAKAEGRLADYAGNEVPKETAREELPEGVTEDDIQNTMKLYGVTREQVIARLKKGG